MDLSPHPGRSEGLAAHRAAIDALNGSPSGPRTVVTIDDADRLDDASAAADAFTEFSAGDPFALVEAVRTAVDEGKEDALLLLGKALRRTRAIDETKRILTDTKARLSDADVRAQLSPHPSSADPADRCGRPP